jgi:hypothetical protein
MREQRGGRRQGEQRGGAASRGGRASELGFRGFLSSLYMIVWTSRRQWLDCYFHAGRGALACWGGSPRPA